MPRLSFASGVSEPPLPTRLQAEVDVLVDFVLLVLLLALLEVLVELQVKVERRVSVVEHQPHPRAPPVVVDQLHREAWR